MATQEKAELDLSEFCDLDKLDVRREVRRNYRDLAQNIEENAQEVIKPDSTKLHEYLEKAEDLFSKVRHPREAVCDSAFILSLTKKGTEQVQQLKTDVISFENNIFAEKLITFMNGRSLADVTHNRDDDDDDEEEHRVHLSKAAWHKLNNTCAPLFRSAPTFDFLLGPLIIQLPVKVQRAKQQREKQPDASQKVVLNKVDKVDEQEEATTKEVERIFKILKNATKQGKKAVCLFDFIVNPESFGQTVENLFHLSFLIKDGKAIIDLDDDELPILNIHQPYREEDYQDVVLRKQVVMPLTMGDWREIIEAYNITKSTIPTREMVPDR